MSHFERRLDQIDALGELASKPDEHWWKDLLSLWRPSGIEAGEFGLRLAIRNNYLNFYRRGQSIARVEINRAGIPVANVHIKYVADSKDKAYVQLRNGWLKRGGRQWEEYQGPRSIQKWIKAVDDGHVGEEKSFVDRLVASNPNVIDLEMGLPAWGDQTCAPRMDLVVIESSADSPKVVFWEAKRSTDGRLRCRVEAVQDRMPEVLRQLADYRRFLREPNHVELVSSAYGNVANLLNTLRRMADGLGQGYPLGSGILAAASGAKLGVDGEPRLVVVNVRNANRRAWELHAEKLREMGVTMTVMEPDGPYELSPALTR